MVDIRLHKYIGQSRDYRLNACWQSNRNDVGKYLRINTQIIPGKFVDIIGSGQQHQYQSG